MANPVGERLGENVRDLRGDLGQRELAERVSDLGLPTRLNTISRTERGVRDVTVDELVALALALDVTPNRLLLTGSADDDEVALTPDLAVAAGNAWRWASGERRLPEASNDLVGANSSFVRANRPHDPPDLVSLRELEDHGEGLDAVHAAMVHAAQEQGVPLRLVYADMRQRARLASSDDEASS